MAYVSQKDYDFYSTQEVKSLYEQFLTKVQPND
jgi:hypothetical protein